MSFESAIGAQAPLGFWDPLGLLKDADEERFERLRTVEIKHGRISMLAILGHLVTSSGSRLPGEIAYGTPFASIKSGLAAFEGIPPGGLFQLVSNIIKHCITKIFFIKTILLTSISIRSVSLVCLNLDSRKLREELRLIVTTT